MDKRQGNDELTRSFLSVDVELLVGCYWDHLALSEADGCAILPRSRQCSFLYYKRTDKEEQALLERGGREIPAIFCRTVGISEVLKGFFQLYVEMQLRRLDGHGKCK